MATLAFSFLQDLNDLDDDEEEEQQQQQQNSLFHSNNQRSSTLGFNSVGCSSAAGDSRMAAVAGPDGDDKGNSRDGIRKMEKELEEHGAVSSLNSSATTAGAAATNTSSTRLKANSSNSRSNNIVITNLSSRPDFVATMEIVRQAMEITATAAATGEKEEKQNDGTGESQSAEGTAAGTGTDGNRNRNEDNDTDETMAPAESINNESSSSSSSSDSNSNNQISNSNKTDRATPASAAAADFKLIDRCNQLVLNLDNEILNIYSFIRSVYSKKFPELESIIFSPLEYIATVNLIKNETDLTLIDLSNILPNTVIMAVTVAASMTTGLPLSQGELDRILELADEAMHLADCRRDLLIYLESQMNRIAPNVTAIIGAALTARVITHSGGLTSLARMPAQNIILVGASGSTAKTRASSSSSGRSGGGGIARGVIYSCDLIQNSPPDIRNRALKLVAGKLSLAARVDSFHDCPNGDIGKSLREKIVQSLIKAGEPAAAPTKKALAVPDEGPKHRRGGKRHRRNKEKYGMSELRKKANRLTFGTEAEEEVWQDKEGGFGTIGKDLGRGRLRLQAKQNKAQIKQQRKQQRRANVATAISVGTAGASLDSSGTAGGLSSSLVFTPLQGIELTNPDALRQTKVNQRLGRDYFSSSVTFSTSTE